MKRAFLILYLLQAVAFACEVAADAQKITIEGFGIIYAGDIEAQGASRFSLFNSVCVEGTEGWELRAETAAVEVGNESYHITAAQVEFRLAEWLLEAEALESFQSLLKLSHLKFSSTTMSGQATEGLYNLGSGEVELSEVSARGKSFYVAGSKAWLVGTRLNVEDATATTCTCEGDPFYVLKASSAEFDLEQLSVTIQNGQLQVASLDIALNNRTLSEASLSRLRFPLTISYIADNPKTGEKGSGLGINLSSLAISEDFDLELGLSGLDAEHALSAVLMTHYDDGKVSFDVGHSNLGPQADFAVRQSLTPWLKASFALQNRHWQAQDFLHQAYLSLETLQQFNLSNHKLKLETSLLAAASSQIVNEQAVAGSRLGASASFNYLAPKHAFGQLSFGVKAEGTYYPEIERWQYGLSLNPRYQASFGALNLDLNYLQRWTNAASPFSKKLDRLEPASELNVYMRYAATLAGAKASAELRLRYDLLNLDESFWAGLETLSFTGKLSFAVGNLSLVPFMSGELAPAFNAGLEDLEAFVETGLDLKAEAWETGFSIRFDPAFSELKKLETRFSFPLFIEKVAFRPFLALDFAPSLNARELPRISGHGLELTLPTCCGTLIAAYRQQENVFSTSIAVRFEDLNLAE